MQLEMQQRHGGSPFDNVDGAKLAGFANCIFATFGDREKKVDCHRWLSTMAINVPKKNHRYKKSGY